MDTPPCLPPASDRSAPCRVASAAGRPRYSPRAKGGPSSSPDHPTGRGSLCEWHLTRMPPRLGTPTSDLPMASSCTNLSAPLQAVLMLSRLRPTTTYGSTSED